MDYSSKLIFSLILKEEPEKKDEMLAKFYEFQTKANIYHAYHTIQRYTDEPFTSYMPEALFNISRYLMHELLNESAVPKGVSRFAVLYALAKQSRNLGKNFEISSNYLVSNAVFVPNFCCNDELSSTMS